MSEWMPIETAPQDDWILAAEARSPDSTYPAYAARWHSAGYWMVNCGQPVVYPSDPTHWMPLPSPPE